MSLNISWKLRQFSRKCRGHSWTFLDHRPHGPVYWQKSAQISRSGWSISRRLNSDSDSAPGSSSEAEKPELKRFPVQDIQFQSMFQFFYVPINVSIVSSTWSFWNYRPVRSGFTRKSTSTPGNNFRLRFFLFFGMFYYVFVGFSCFLLCFAMFSLFSDAAICFLLFLTMPCRHQNSNFPNCALRRYRTSHVYAHIKRVVNPLKG